MATYKKHKPYGGRSTKAVGVYIDEDLWAAYKAEPNKTRLINNALRTYIELRKNCHDGKGVYGEASSCAP